MIALMEDFYDQIVHKDLLKKDKIPKNCVQTAFKSLTYSYLDLNVKTIDQN